MPIDLSIYDRINTQFGQQLGQALDPAYHAEKRNALADLMNQRKLRDIQVQTQQAGLDRLPVMQQRADSQYQFSQQELLRKQAEEQRKQEILSRLTPEQQQLYALGGGSKLVESMMPERLSPADRLAREKFDFDRRQTGKEKPSDRLARERFEWEKSKGLMETKPKLKPGERFIEGSDSVEAIPGSDLYKTQSGKHAKDYQVALSAKTNFDEASKKIDYILDEKNKGAFNSHFGGYNAYLTKHIPGATQEVGAKIESLKSDLKMAGLGLIRQGGSIGMMTEREWPIVQDMIDRIDPRMGEPAARAAFENIRTYMGRIKDNADEIYRTEWGGSQFAKPDNTVRGAGYERTATNPQTGQKIGLRGGKWEPIR